MLFSPGDRVVFATINPWHWRHKWIPVEGVIYTVWSVEDFETVKGETKQYVKIKQDKRHGRFKYFSDDLRLATPLEIIRNRISENNRNIRQTRTS